MKLSKGLTDISHWKEIIEKYVDWVDEEVNLDSPTKHCELFHDDSKGEFSHSLPSDVAAELSTARGSIKISAKA